MGNISILKKDYLKEINWKNHRSYMELALLEAQAGVISDEVPIGAVAVSLLTGEVLARAHNHREHTHNPCGHAEMFCVQKSAKTINDWRLNKVLIYVTIEPCIMCLSCMILARVGGVIFGAYDLKGGALSLGYNFHQDKRLNHNFVVAGGFMQRECSQLLSNYFAEKRLNK